MRITVSLPEADVAFLDQYARASAAPSRSAVLREAVQRLRATALGLAYAAAWQSWEAEGHGEAWEPLIADGLDDSDSP